MSYSFSVKAETKGEASLSVCHEFDKIIASQPVHAADRELAEAATDAFIDLLPDDESQDVLVNVHGSVMTNGAGVYSASVGISVSLARRFETTTG